MTKSEQIMSLYDGTRTTTEIAAIVGCNTSYVRVVARQRKGRGVSDIDRKHRASDSGRERWKRKAHLCSAYGHAYVSEFRRSGDREMARSSGRDAYRKAKQS